MFRPRSLVVAIFAVGLIVAPMNAQELRLPLPKKSKYTPVQKLNRDGVKAVEKHQYDKAKKLFYKAYLIDPNDPFTLNNLGYLAELEGDADRAQRFYQLASEQNSDAIVDVATNSRVEGKPVSTVAGNAEEKGIQVNRLNSEAIALLSRDRAPEADLLLQKALKIDPRNPFTLNNLGFAKEREGELDAAYQFYTAAANTNSGERIQIALNKDWRGEEISYIAGRNARRLDQRLRNEGSLESRVALLNLRGVSAFNRNERRTAREFIQKAYKLDPDDAFTLNNMGYLAEMDGDRETADYYYARARDANSSGTRVAIATRKDALGKQIGDFAESTDNLVLGRMEDAQEARRRMGGPVLLRSRADNQPIVEPQQPVVTPSPDYRVSDANGDLILPPRSTVDSSTPVNSGGLAMPLPDSQQPVTVHQGDTDHGLIMPLPEGEQPNGQHPNNQPPQQTPPQPQGEIDHGLMMPLPDSQQPGAPPAPSKPKQGETDHGMIMPLPDDQQPGAAQPPQRQAAPQPQTQQSIPQPQQGPNDKGLLMPLPDNQQPNVQPPKPAQAQPVPQAQPGILLPPPRQQSQPPAAQTPPNSNTGVSAPPAPATQNAPPNKISDFDLGKNKQSDTNNKSKPDDSKSKKKSDGVIRITDQDE